MKIPIPMSEVLSSTVDPRTVKTEPSRNIAAASKPATPTQRQTRLVRWIATEITATRAVTVQMTGVRPCIAEPEDGHLVDPFEARLALPLDP